MSGGFSWRFYLQHIVLEEPCGVRGTMPIFGTAVAVASQDQNIVRNAAFQKGSEV